MSNWEYLNKRRLDHGPYASTPKDGFNGKFHLEINGLRIVCVVSDGAPDPGGLEWQHVSVSIYDSTFTPSWSVMCQVKDLFWEPEDVVIQYHPRQSEYVNMHPGCLHLWRPKGVVLPEPPRIAVGFKDASDIKKVRDIKKMKGVA